MYDDHQHGEERVWPCFRGIGRNVDVRSHCQTPNVPGYGTHAS